MIRSRWKWLLPIVQLVLALTCHFYDPYVYRVRARRDRAVNNTEYLFQHSPAWAERISQGINFPALVLAYPFRNESNAVYERNSVYTLIWISPGDIAFFVGILLFWYWLGLTLDERSGPSPKTIWPSRPRMAGLVGGIAFGILTGVYAGQKIGGGLHPERQIGAFGIVWALALTAYFTWRFIRALSAGKGANLH
jgi:hypothetical protein